MISSTSSSSSAVVGVTAGGLYGRTVGPSMTCDASGGTVSSSGTLGLIDPDSVASLATPVSAPKGPALPAVALGIVTEPTSADDDPSPSLAPLVAVVDFSAGCRALGDLDMGPAGVTSASGSARGCSSVWVDGFGPSVCLALHQIIWSSAKKAKIR